MSARFVLLGAFAVVTAGGFVEKAEAQIVIVADVQFAPANKNQPATASPRGTLSLPGDGNIYRVFCDYGTIADGAFTQDKSVSMGGAGSAVVSKLDVNPATVSLLEAFPRLWPVALADTNGNAAWSVSGPQILLKPPADLYARVRLQMLNGTKWIDLPPPGAVAYISVPIP